MAANTDDLTLASTTSISRDMHLPPTPPDDYSDENKNRLQTPPMQTLQQLLTPDNTPPGMILQPPRPPFLSRETTSRANSFRTAREELSREFLNAADDADSQFESAISSRAASPPNGSVEASDDEPWREIPGAFRSTPSTTSSRSAGRLEVPRDPNRTPSTGSSDKSIRPKQYLDVESPPSTGSSRDLARSRKYRHDTESPLDRQRTYEDEHMNGSTSCAHSDRSLEEETEDSDNYETGGEDLHEEEDEEDDEEDEDEEEDVESTSRDEDNDNTTDNKPDWTSHVSYLAQHEDGNASARASPASSRLSGNGKRVGNNGSQPTTKGMNNPPITASSAMVEQGLIKRGSDESSCQRSDDTPSPSVSAQKRRQRAAAHGGGVGKETATPREIQKLNWLRQHSGLLASPDIPAEFLAAPPRNSNDLVYKHIQQANMDKFDALKNGKAVEAVVIPTNEARNRHLRHVTKRQSLRSVSDNNSSYMPGSAPRRDHAPRFTKAPTPQKIPQPSSPESPHNARSVSGSHSLRHEKRPLSGAGRPLKSNDVSPALSNAKVYPKFEQKPVSTSKEPPKLRHSSLPIHLDNSTNLASPVTSESSKGERRRTHALRRSSREYRIENTHASADHVPEQKPASTIVETTTFTSPHLLGFGLHNHNRSQGTPISISAVSDRTEMEVCEARNVALYPHSNDSLLVVQHRSKPEHKDQDAVPSTTRNGRPDTGHEAKHAGPASQPSPVDATPAIAVNGKSIHTVDSPLTNPREAPVPPVINFIPATPSHEDDEREIPPIGEEEAPNTPQRRNSLAKRARRYSEVVVRPLFGRTTVTRSHNIRPSPTASEKRDERLHPNWVPNSFWHDDDDDDDDYYSDPEEPFERLPAGGDTSEHPRAKFPRNMSVRMPGFHGSGGFLLGNSLGVDRHGTNKRRPYITPPSSSSGVAAPKQTIRRSASRESMASHVSGDGRIFVIPGTHTRLQYVGFKPIKDKIRKRRETKEDAAREKRRAELKDQIGMRIVHDA